MKYYTEENLDKLKEIEDNFNHAVNAGYISRAKKIDSKLVYDIYAETTGEKPQYNPNCGTCMFNLFYQAGKLYFETKKFYEEQKLQQKETIKKVGRPKKQV